MFLLSRPKKEPILRGRVDTSNSKKQIKGRLYPEEKQVLENKIEERGYSSIADWIEDQARKVILDQDLKERREDLENKIENKEKDIEELKEELEDINNLLGDREEELNQLKDKLRKFLEEKINPDEFPSESEIKKIIRKTEDYGISINDMGKAESSFIKTYNKLSSGDIDPNNFSDILLESWIDENIITIGRD